MCVTETKRDGAKLLAGTLVLVAGKIFIQQLQTVRHHPDARAFRTGQGRAMRSETGNQQPRFGINEFLLRHGNPVVDQLRMIGAVQIVGHLHGIQRDTMIKHPAFIRIAFKQHPWTFLEACDNGVHPLGQQRFVFRFFFNHPPRGEHQGDFTVEKEAVRWLHDIRPVLGVGHQKEIHPLLFFQPQGFINDSIHRPQIKRLGHWIAQRHVRE